MLESSSTAKDFAKQMLGSVWRVLGAVATVATLGFIPRQWWWVVPSGLLVLVVIGAHDLYRRTRKDCEAQLQRQSGELKANIELLQAEVERLKVSPFDAEQRELVLSKVKPLTDDAKTILRYLLHHGPTQAVLLGSGMDRASYSEAFNSLTISRLIERPPDSIELRVKPEFEGILKEILFPRRDL